MNVQCLSCSSRYSVPDAKVQGRKVRIKCKRCSEPILIDGTHLGRALVVSNRPIQMRSEPAPEPVVAPAPKRQTLLGLPNALGGRANGATSGTPRGVAGNAPKPFQKTLLGGLGVATAQASAQARKPAPLPPAYPPAPWTVAVTEDDQRELTTDQVVALYAVGTIDEGTYVWRDGMDDWCSPFESPDLRRALQAARISPREPLDSDEDEDEAFDQSDEPIVPSSPLADESDDPRHPGMWHEPGRLGGDYEPSFEDVTVSMNEKETEGLLRKAFRADFEDEPTVARGSARPQSPFDEPTVARGATRPHSPFAEATARAPSPARAVRSQNFAFEEEEVTRAISTTEARAPLDRHDNNASQRAFELSQRKHGPQAPPPVRARSSGQPAHNAASQQQRPGERQESSVMFSLDALTRKSSGSSRPPPTAQPDAFASTAPAFHQPPPRPPIRKPPPSVPSAPLQHISAFPPAVHPSSHPPASPARGVERAYYSSAPPALDRTAASAVNAMAVERAYPSAPPAPSVVAQSRPALPIVDEDSDVFAYPGRKRAKWPFVAALLLVVGAVGASYQFREPLGLWAKVYDLSGGQFPAWSELRPPAALETPKPPPAAKPPAPPPTPPPTAEAAPTPTETTDTPAATEAEVDRKKSAPEAEPKRERDPAPAKDASQTAAEPAKPEPEPDTTESDSDKTENLPEFDRGAAAEALGAAAASAATCKAADGPTGRGRATVTFANSGRATNANVTGTFAGTAVGGCVAELFRQARVPAFSGPPVKVAKSFSVE